MIASIRKFLFNEYLLMAGAKFGFKGFLLIFTFLLATHLSQGDFGDFQFISSIVNLIAQPSIAFTLMATRISFKTPADDRIPTIRWLLDKTLLIGAVFGICIIAIFGFMDPVLRTYASVSMNNSLTLASAIVVPAMILNLVIGYAQALGSFAWVAATFYLMGIITAVLGIAIVVFDLGVLSAYGAQAVANVLALIFLIVVLVVKLPDTRRKLDRFILEDVKFCMKAMLSMLVFFAFLNFDIFMAKGIFNRIDAGFYLRTEFIAKFFFVLASGVGMVLFTFSVSDRETGAAAIAKLKRGFLYFFVLSTIGLVILYFMSPIIFRLLYGPEFSPGGSLVGGILFARFAQAVIFVILGLLGNAINRWCIITLLAAMMCEFLILRASPMQLDDLALAAAISSVAAAAVLLVIAMKTRLRTYQSELGYGE